MTMQVVGYAGLAWATGIAAAATDNLLVAVTVVAILVALSTLLIRLFLVVDHRIDARLNSKMLSGELPTQLERQETQRTLEQLTVKLDRLLEDD